MAFNKLSEAVDRKWTDRTLGPFALRYQLRPILLKASNSAWIGRSCYDRSMRFVDPFSELGRTNLFNKVSRRCCRKTCAKFVWGSEQAQKPTAECEAVGASQNANLSEPIPSSSDVNVCFAHSAVMTPTKDCFGSPLQLSTLDHSLITFGKS